MAVETWSIFGGEERGHFDLQEEESHFDLSPGKTFRTVSFRQVCVTPLMPFLGRGGTAINFVALIRPHLVIDTIGYNDRSWPRWPSMAGFEVGHRGFKPGQSGRNVTV